MEEVKRSANERPSMKSSKNQLEKETDYTPTLKQKNELKSTNQTKTKKFSDDSESSDEKATMKSAKGAQRPASNLKSIESTKKIVEDFPLHEVKTRNLGRMKSTLETIKEELNRFAEKGNAAELKQLLTRAYPYLFEVFSAQIPELHVTVIHTFKKSFELFQSVNEPYLYVIDKLLKLYETHTNVLRL
jgi:hypothetical protein